MKCPRCGQDGDRVLETRTSQAGSVVRRRRECTACHFRFTTYETIERMPLVVIKRDGTREPYDRTKLLNGIATACRKRPISAEKIEAIVNDIEDDLSDRYQTEIKSAEIGRMILDRLLEVDEVSYVRFASVYRKFTNIDKFAKELSKIKKERKCKKRRR
ncbi:MAG TPA: transcriptional repressor NrdR [candidate division WOR-3 bacterium]|uniref:Transcriptional repressor NrdR n=1 Tax=candidate division WOR-3 bacterium TaxID=2052148 RepID=A0A9C9EN63_UNCW3|nr:transcriptional repressor NrdR [candidate division WOR-3 bacterium]